MRPRSVENIRQFVASRPAGEPFGPRDLLTCGTRASIDQALTRLTREGVIERVARGVYVRPKRSRIVGKVPPSAEAVARTYARTRGIAVGHTGAQALVDMGLTTQTPVSTVLDADVRETRTLQVGGRQVALRHAPKFVLRHAGTPVGEALAALHHLGSRRRQEGQAVLGRVNAETFQRLLDLRPTLPGWLADLITITARGGRS